MSSVSRWADRFCTTASSSPTALDHLRSRSTEDPVTFSFPSTSFSLYTTPSSLALENSRPVPRPVR